MQESIISLSVASSARRRTMDAGYSNLRKALLEIAHFGERQWKNRGGMSHIWAYDVLEAEWLDRKLPRDADRIEIPLSERKRGVFLLPPTRNAVACLLAVKWKFVAPPVDVKKTAEQNIVSNFSRGVFRVFLIPPDTARPRPQPTVVRFDEREDNKSWRFAHAQICDRMSPYDNLFGKPTSWISAELPRIPLAATHGPAPILVCLLASLYGAKHPLLAQVVRVLRDKSSGKIATELGCLK